jgi:hypothetical protein
MAAMYGILVSFLFVGLGVQIEDSGQHLELAHANYVIAIIWAIGWHAGMMLVFIERAVGDLRRPRT